MNIHPHPRPMVPTVLFPYVGGSGIGGSHISSFKLIKTLRERGTAHPIVGAHQMSSEFVDFAAEHGISLVDFSAMPIISPRATRGTANDVTAGAWLARSVPAMRRYLNTHAIDLVHTNDGRIHASWALPTALSQARMVWHHRSDPTARAVNLLAPFLADHVVTVSEFAAPKNPLRPIGHKWSVVHSPFDPTPLPDRVAAKKRLLGQIGAPEGTRVLGYFGGLIPRKRPVHFVDAVADFIDAHPEIPVAGVICGTAPAHGPALDDEARARAALRGVSDQIHLMGFCSPVEPWIAGSDVLLVPALDEPFGRTLIEAMHLGTVVIATKHGGNIEAIREGETGLLVDPHDSKAFVPAIHRVLSDENLRQRILHTAKTHAMTHLTLDVHVDQIEDIYAKLMTKGALR